MSNKLSFKIISLSLALVFVLATVTSCSGKNGDKGKNSSNQKGQSGESSMVTSDIESGTASMSSGTASGTASEQKTYKDTRDNKPADGKYKNVNILCLGDSITQGNGTPSGYRYQLFERLYSQGATFTFVGPQTSSDTRLPDRYKKHDGVGGRKIEQVTEEISKLSQYKYDIVLVMAGRNNQNESLETIEKKYRQMIDALVAHDSSAYIYLAEVIPTKGQGVDQLTTFNTKLPGICEEYKKKGNKVFCVGMETNSWTDSMYVDSVHPNELGNAKIASCFCDAIIDQTLMLCDQGDPSYKEPVRVKSISISKSALTLQKGTASTLTAKTEPSNAEVFTVLWSSSDTSVATVSSGGKVTGVAPGTATITAKSLDGGHSKTCTVKVAKGDADSGTAVVTNVLSDVSNLTGDTASVVGGAIQASYNNKKLTVETKNQYSAGKNFRVAFTYSCRDNEKSNYDSMYCSVAYGGFEVMVYDCVNRIELKYDGTKIGTYKNPENHSSGSNEYMLIVKNGTAKVTFAGETVIEVSVSNSNANSTVVVVANEGYRVESISHIDIYKF